MKNRKLFLALAVLVLVVVAIVVIIPSGATAQGLVVYEYGDICALIKDDYGAPPDWEAVDLTSVLEFLEIKQWPKNNGLGTTCTPIEDQSGAFVDVKICLFRYTDGQKGIDGKIDTGGSDKKVNNSEKCQTASELLAN